MILRKLFNKPFNTRPKVAGQEDSFQCGNTEVVLLKGDNVNLPIKVDVIVTTINSHLNHGIATASSTIAEKAGIRLQREIQEQKIKLPLGEDDIIATSGGKLACSKVYYVTLLPRKQHHTAAIKTLIWKCLEKANSSSFKSLAFPALGTGKLHYPHSDVAYAMFGAVGEYGVANPTSSVCRVFFVILPSNTDVLKAFKEANKNLKESQLLNSTSLRENWDLCDEFPMQNEEAIPERMTPEFCLYMYNAKIHPPSYWTRFTSDKTVKEWNTGQPPCTLVDIDKNSNTFTVIKGLVEGTWEADIQGIGRDAYGLDGLQYGGLKITRIQRVENLILYEQYATRRQVMFLASGKAGIYPKLRDVPDMKGGSSHIKELLNYEWAIQLYNEVNEEYFFHGTKTDRVGQVYAQGLDPRLAANGTQGPAVYMAESSMKADQYTDSRSARQSNGLTMFLVRACLGNICRVTKCRQMRRPPCTDSSCSNDECQHVDRYDSIVAEELFIFREFVVYDRNQVYPEYVISYDRV